MGAVHLEVLDDPLGVGLAQGARCTAREGVGHRSASREVFNRGGAGGGGCSVHRYPDLISGRDGDAVEIIGIFRVPLVPGVKGSDAILDTEVDAWGSGQLDPRSE